MTFSRLELLAMKRAVNREIAEIDNEFPNGFKDNKRVDTQHAILCECYNKLNNLLKIS